MRSGPILGGPPPAWAAQAAARTEQPSFLQQVADRVGCENPQSASELLAAVDVALARADARRAHASARVQPVKTGVQLADEAFDALFGAQRASTPPPDRRTDDEVYDELFGARS